MNMPELEDRTLKSGGRDVSIRWNLENSQFLNLAHYYI